MSNIFTRFFHGIFGVPTPRPMATRNELKPNMRRALLRKEASKEPCVIIAEERAKRLLEEMAARDTQHIPQAEQA